MYMYINMAATPMFDTMSFPYITKADNRANH